MMAYGNLENPPERYRVEAGRLWASGIATGVVAALVALVGILVARGLFKVAVLAPKDHGLWGDARTATYAVVSAAVALLATGLIHVLCLAVAEPRTFFRWIMALLTVIAVVSPLTVDAEWGPRIGTALINLAIGVVITAIIDSVAAVTLRRRPTGGAAPTPPAGGTARTRRYDEPLYYDR
jgi:hypothetical protein